MFHCFSISYVAAAYCSWSEGKPVICAAVGTLLSVTLHHLMADEHLIHSCPLLFFGTHLF